ncbi:MAG: DoxX family protein [Planctomycetota bacterium]|nr:DoxX family protein [Planctomycetota bacterium]
MNDFALLLLRIVAGLGLASHGYNAIVNGGVEAIEGFAGFLGSLGFPAPMAFAWIAKGTELVGGVCVAVGLLTRPAAFLCAATMFIAMLTAHRGDPFEEWELALLYFAAMAVIAMTGPGKYSIVWDAFARDAKRNA